MEKYYLLLHTAVLQDNLSCLYNFALLAAFLTINAYISILATFTVSGGS
jgi:hypothetical protein